MRAYALLADRPTSGMAGGSALVVVNLQTKLSEITYPIEADVDVTSLAVSPDGNFCYITDASHGKIIRLDISPGYVQKHESFPAQGAQDCVLSADGGTLYVAAVSSLYKFDTATMTITASLITNDRLWGIALSKDEATIAIAATSGGHEGKLYLVNTANLTQNKTVELQNTDSKKSGCPSNTFDVVFTDAGHVLVWNPYCNAVYQVDVAKASQVNQETISLGAPLDEGDVSRARNYANQLSYSDASARAHLVRASELAIADPVGLGSKFQAQFSGEPFMASLAPDGESLYVCVQKGDTDVLDLYKYNRQSKNYTSVPAIFSFTKPPMYVRDLRILSEPFGPSFPVSQYVTLAEAVHILSGIVNDAAGVYIGPDGRLHRLPPGDPRPDPLWANLTPRTQDALLGLALNGVASVIHNADARRRLQQEALRLTQRSVNKMLASLK